MWLFCIQNLVWMLVIVLQLDSKHMKKKIKVYKFGGTSVGSVEQIQAIADRLMAESSTTQHVVVVSAMGHTTDQLVKLCSQISTSPEPREYDALISTGENVLAMTSLAIPVISIIVIVLTNEVALTIKIISLP